MALILTILFMAVTSAGSAEFMAVSSLFTYAPSCLQLHSIVHAHHAMCRATACSPASLVPGGRLRLLSSQEVAGGILARLPRGVAASCEVHDIQCI